jgi:hypothetical protein
MELECRKENRDVRMQEVKLEGKHRCKNTFEQVTYIAVTNCLPLARRMMVSCIASHERASSLSFRCTVSNLSNDNIYREFKKTASQWYCICYCVASVTGTFTLKGVQIIHHSAVRLLALCTGRALFPRHIIFILLILIYVRG